VPVFNCGRSFYIDLRMVVVVGGEMSYIYKKEGGHERGEMSSGMSHSHQR